eukprot:scaffold137175_cov30-Tisochrysis_lutea.AAC.5
MKGRARLRTRAWIYRGGYAHRCPGAGGPAVAVLGHEGGNEEKALVVGRLGRVGSDPCHSVPTVEGKLVMRMLEDPVAW